MNWLDKFHLTTTQRKGYIALLFILLGVLIIRVAVSLWPVDHEEFISTLPEEIATWEAEKRAAMLVPHAFDPNTIADSTIRTFNISRFAAENWIKFRNRGNRFLSPQDLFDIYAMDSTWVIVNLDSIQIVSGDDELAPIKRFAFDPNTIDKRGLISLGIPEFLAERIIRYREKGGVFKKP